MRVDSPAQVVLGTRAASSATHTSKSFRMRGRYHHFADPGPNRFKCDSDRPFEGMLIAEDLRLASKHVEDPCVLPSVITHRQSDICRYLMMSLKRHHRRLRRINLSTLRACSQLQGRGALPSGCSLRRIPPAGRACS